MVHDVMTPEPVRVGDSGTSELAVLLVKLKSSGEYEMLGRLSTTVRLIKVVDEPPVLVAVTEYVVRGETTVGVPEISPFVMFNSKPVGKSGLTVNL